MRGVTHSEYEHYHLVNTPVKALELMPKPYSSECLNTRLYQKDKSLEVESQLKQIL